MKRCTRNACLTAEESDCVELTAPINEAVMKLYDLEVAMERSKLRWCDGDTKEDKP